MPFSVTDGKHKERILFLKRLVKNPKALGAVMPSSKALARMIAGHAVMDTNGYIVEVGAGTGSFTCALLEAGINPERLIVVELDSELCVYLSNKFQGVHIVQGDATQLSALLPPHIIGQASTIISGIPLINLNKSEQSLLIQAFKNVLLPEGNIIQFTYGPLSPLPHRKLGMRAVRLGFVLKNVPPATVWSFTFSPYVANKALNIQRYFGYARLRAKRTAVLVRRAVRRNKV